MGKIFTISKRGIIAILTLCILLCTTGIGVHAISMPEENIAVTAEETTVVVEETKVAIEGITVADEETTSELMPMMARGCCGDTYGTYAWSSIDSALAHYNMPASSVHECNVTYNGIHYSYYVQMDSFRIYVRLA